MKHILKLEIECGEKTCASEPGKFCKWLSTRKMGTIRFCWLFSADHQGKATPLEEDEKHGWIQRHPDCLACAEKSK